MPNLVGIGNSQVPTNAMLGGLAYQDSVGEINIDKIKAKTSDTAVDIFVYDTRKDSDGGAWRHRTQNTSWYNEGVSATRGARKEFPAVAVIVSTTTQVTIYDGDDPNLPMWMVFVAGSNGFNNVRLLQYANQNGYHLAALNGILVIGEDTNGDNWGSPIINFISEYIVRMDPHSSEGGVYNGGVAQRNDTVGFNSPGKLIIINSQIHDVAMTVLPNAPIDESTGLPIPTIAVATHGGFSVIRDDGSVIDKGVSGTETNEVAWYKGQYLLGSGPEYWALYKDLSEESSGYISGTADLYSAGNNTTWDKPQPTGKETKVVAVGDLIAGGSATAYTGHVPGLSLKHPTSNLSNGNSNLLCEIRKDYNTGWMQGDIKSAFLSDTSTTNITGSELVTNGNFAANSNWTYQGGTTSFNISSGKLNYDGSGSIYLKAYQNITGLTVGQTYVLSIKLVSISSHNISFAFATSNIGNTLLANTVSTTGTHSITYTATQANISVYIQTNNATMTFSVDDVSLRIAEDDRSINNKGLQVYGTITKEPVATGAELVAYSGFFVDNFTSNYLFQPHNTDFEFGTDDYSVMLWYKGTSSSTGSREIFANLRGSTNYWVLSKEYTNKFVFDTVTDPNTYAEGVWNHVAGVRRSGIAYLYVNGELVGSAAANDNITDTSDGLLIGHNPDNNDWRTRGFLALLRISASAPTKEQIKKIYNDEKCLFNENSKCTLHGTSDDIKAISFDDTDDILHVGTSSGRSEFQGLNRINNTTTAVTTAISASNGLVAEQ